MNNVRHNPAALLSVLLLTVACFSAKTHAQVIEGGNTTHLPSLSSDFGALALVGEMNSAEHYGAMQSRLGAYNADATGDARIATFVMPANAIIPISGDGKWFTKLGAVYVRSEGNYSGGDLPTSTSRNFLAQALYRPAAGTLMGLGLIPDRADVAIPASNASVHARSTGVRFDLLQRFGVSSGMSAKLVHLEGHSTLDKTLPNGQKLSIRSSTARTYLETTFTTILDSTKLSLVPQGWSLRPVTHVLLQRDEERNPQTGSSHEDFAQWMLTARLQKDVFRAGQIGPYIEIGTELELANDAAADGNSNLLLYGKTGAAFILGNWGRLDAYYARRQAPDNGFASNTINLLLSATF